MLSVLFVAPQAPHEHEHVLTTNYWRHWQEVGDQDGGAGERIRKATPRSLRAALSAASTLRPKKNAITRFAASLESAAALHFQCRDTRHVKAVVYGGVTRCRSTWRRRVVSCACGSWPECLAFFTSCVPACVLVCACSPLSLLLKAALKTRGLDCFRALLNVAGPTQLVYEVFSY